MPITTAYESQEVPYIQILDEAGNVDKKLEPKIPSADLIKLYETMVLSREFDHRRLRLQRQGRIGTFAPAHGQEACQAGSAYYLRNSDWICPAFRETTIMLYKGIDLANDLLYCAGFEEGMAIGPDEKITPICIPIGTQYTHALGCAWAEKLDGTDNIAITYGGDGSTSEGDFHEAINMCGVMNMPVVFFIQNNQWAISVPRSKQTKSQTIAQKGIAYGIPCYQVDGNDILAVMHVTKLAIEHARAGKGPSIIEGITFRMNVHTTADDPSKYRPKSMEEEWAKKDPITRFRTYLQKKKIWTQAKEDALQESVKAKLDDAVERFETKKKELAGPEYMFANAWVEEPVYLARQRKELMAHFDEYGLPEGMH